MTKKPLALVLLKNNFTRFTYTQSERVFWCSASRVNPVQQALSGSGQAKLPKEEHYFLYSKVSLNTFLASRSNPWILLAREVGQRGCPYTSQHLIFSISISKEFLNSILSGGSSTQEQSNSILPKGIFFALNLSLSNFMSCSLVLVWEKSDTGHSPRSFISLNTFWKFKTTASHVFFMYTLDDSFKARGSGSH